MIQNIVMDGSFTNGIVAINNLYKGKDEISITTGGQISGASVFDWKDQLFIIKIENEDVTDDTTDIGNVYLYFDGSTFFWSITPPTWNAAYQGWYTGDDRAFFKGYKDFLGEKKYITQIKHVNFSRVNTSGNKAFRKDELGLVAGGGGVIDGFHYGSTQAMRYFTIVNGDLITYEAITRVIQVHDGFSSTIIRTFDPPGTTLSGIAYDEVTGNLLTADNSGGSYNDVVSVHSGITSTILSNFTTGMGIVSMTIDNVTGNLITRGEYYASNTRYERIFVMDGISGTILQNINLGFTLTASSWNDAANKDNYITCDWEARKIYMIGQYGFVSVYKILDGGLIQEGFTGRSSIEASTAYAINSIIWDNDKQCLITSRHDATVDVVQIDRLSSRMFIG